MSKGGKDKAKTLIVERYILCCSDNKQERKLWTFCLADFADKSLSFQRASQPHACDIQVDRAIWAPHLRGTDRDLRGKRIALGLYQSQRFDIWNKSWHKQSPDLHTRHSLLFGAPASRRSCVSFPHQLPPKLQLFAHTCADMS